MLEIKSDNKITHSSDERKARGTGQLASRRDLETKNIYDKFYNKFRLDNNLYLDDNMWSTAATKGELDQLITALQESSKGNKYLDELKKYGNRVDYDTYMLALNLPLMDNEKKEDRISADGSYNFGSMTNLQWGEKVLQATTQRYEAEEVEEYKDTIDWWVKVGAGLVSAAGHVSGGIATAFQNVYNLGEGIVNVVTGEDFLEAWADDDDEYFAQMAEQVKYATYELERKTLPWVDAVEAYEQGYIPVTVDESAGSKAFTQAIKNSGYGAGYNTWGRYWSSGLSSIGEMLPFMVIPGAKSAKLTKVLKTGGFYAGNVFSANIGEAVKYAGYDYKSLSTGEVIANAAVKSVAQYAVEVALGKVLGFTGLDAMMGVGDDVARGAAKWFTKAAGATGAKAAGIAIGRGALGMVKEGLEETFQDLSDHLVDLAFGGEYAEKTKQEFSIQNLIDSFVVGALTSGVIGALSTARVAIDRKNRTVAIDKTGNAYKMGVFQQLNYNQALQAMAQWQATLQDKNASIEDKADAAFRLNGVVLTVGNVLKTFGTERAQKALSMLQVYQDKQSTEQQKLDAKLALSDSAYAKELFTEFVKSSKAAELKLSEQLKNKIKKGISDKGKELKEAGVNEILDIITKDTEVTEETKSVKAVKALLKETGAEAIVSTNGKVIVTSNDVIFADDSLIKNGDISKILEGIAYEKAVSSIIPELSKKQTELILSEYQKLSGQTDADINKAVTALLFDKSFYTYILLKTNETQKTNDSNEAIKILATIDKIVKGQIAIDVEKGTLTHAAYMKLISKIQENMRNGLLVYATNYVNIDLDNISGEILPSKLKDLIRTNQNVIATEAINKCLDSQSKGVITASRIDEFDKLIDKFLGINVKYNELIAEAKEKIRSPEYNDRFDACGVLRFLMNEDTKVQLTYLKNDSSTKTIDNSNTALILVTEFFDTDWTSLVEGKISILDFPEDAQKYVQSCGYDLNNYNDRLAMLRERLYYYSNNTLTVSYSGEILQVLDKNKLIKKEYLGKDSDKNLVSDIKAGKVTKIKDICKTTINKKIGNLKIVLNTQIYANGFFTETKPTQITVNGNNIVNTIMHEATHATQYFTRPESVSTMSTGAHLDYLKKVKKSVLNKIEDYIQEKFPLLYSTMLQNPNNNIPAIIYFNVDGEMQAMCKCSSLLFETGFTWNADKTILYSPDGKTSWNLVLKTDKRQDAETETKKEVKENEQSSSIHEVDNRGPSKSSTKQTSTMETKTSRVEETVDKSKRFRKLKNYSVKQIGALEANINTKPDAAIIKEYKDKYNVDVEFFNGAIYLEGEQVEAFGFTDGNTVYLRDDLNKQEYDNTIKHEYFHIKAAKNPKVYKQLKELFKLKADSKQLADVIANYKLRDSSFTDDEILEEILADVYARITSIEISDIDSFNKILKEMTNNKNVAKVKSQYSPQNIIRFKRIPGSEGSKLMATSGFESLVGLITALKQGYITAPSIAINTYYKPGEAQKFGDMMYVFDSSIVDPSANPAANVFTQDIYSTRRVDYSLELDNNNESNAEIVDKIVTQLSRPIMKLFNRPDFNNQLFDEFKAENENLFNKVDIVARLKALAYSANTTANKKFREFVATFKNDFDHKVLAREISQYLLIEKLYRGSLDLIERMLLNKNYNYLINNTPASYNVQFDKNMLSTLRLITSLNDPEVLNVFADKLVEASNIQRFVTDPDELLLKLQIFLMTIPSELPFDNNMLNSFKQYLPQLKYKYITSDGKTFNDYEALERYQDDRLLHAEAGDEYFDIYPDLDLNAQSIDDVDEFKLTRYIITVSADKLNTSDELRSFDRLTQEGTEELNDIEDARYTYRNAVRHLVDFLGNNKLSPKEIVTLMTRVLNSDNDTVALTKFKKALDYLDIHTIPNIEKQVLADAANLITYKTLANTEVGYLEAKPLMKIPMTQIPFIIVPRYHIDDFTAMGGMTYIQKYNNALYEYSGEEAELRRILEDLPTTWNNVTIKTRKDYAKMSESRKISNKVARESNLKYFERPGRPIQLDERVQQFVINTTAEFDKLEPVIQKAIKEGTLTLYDIRNYVETATTMNDYTFKTIAKYIYENDEAAKLTFKDMIKVLENLENIDVLHLFVNHTETDTERMSVNEILKMYKELDKSANTDENVKSKIAGFRNLASTIKPKGARAFIPYEADITQMHGDFLRHYRGTINSIAKLNILGKNKAHNQELLLVGSNEGSGANLKRKGGVWNWIDRIRKADITYGEPEVLNNMLADVGRQDKINTIDEYILRSIIEEAKANPGKYNQQTIIEEYYRQRDRLDDLTDEEVDKLYMAATSEGVQVQTEEIKAIRNELEKRYVRKTQSNKYTGKYASRTSAKGVAKRAGELTAIRLAGLKVRYNELSPDLQELFDRQPNGEFKFNDKYQELSDEELHDIIPKLQEAKDMLGERIRINKASNQAKLKAIERANRQAERMLDKPTVDKKSIREKIDVQHKVVVKVEEFPLDKTVSREQVPKIVNSVLGTSWDKTRQTTVQELNNNIEQNVANAEVFFTSNPELLNMSVAEAEQAAKWFMSNSINTEADSQAIKKFNAVRIYFLGYILSESREGGQFADINHNVKTKIENYLRDQATVAGTALAVWNNVRARLNPIDVMMSQSIVISGVELSENEQRELLDAAMNNDMKKVADLQERILARIKAEQKGKKNTLRQITTIRSMSMLSSPLTWLRNTISNFMLKRLNRWSSKIGQGMFTSKTKEGQLTFTGNITPEIQQFIVDNFVDNGLFDVLVSNLAKYNPSDVSKRFKNKDGTIDKNAILANMVIKSMYGKYYTENMFKGEAMNKIYQGLMKMMSDNNYVREAAIRYFGKIIAEKSYDLSKGVTDAIMTDFANAIGIAMSDYMHSDNFLNTLEAIAAEHSEVTLFAFKNIMPFMATSWNWFKAAIRYSPIGLARSIVKLTRLEHQIRKQEAKWSAGKTQVAPEYTEYLIRRELGSGVIGTMAFGLGVLLAALGWIDLEDEDYGTPKLVIGNLRIDISSIFGTSSVLAGAALIVDMKDDGASWKTLMSGLDKALDVTVDGFFLTELMALDMYSGGGSFATLMDLFESTILSFIPNGLAWFAGATYKGNLRKRGFFGKAAAKVPFLAGIVNERKVDPYTGETGTVWDIFNRVFPYVDIRLKSRAKETAESLGLNKTELRGQYTINDEPFNLSQKEVTEINKQYGEWNAKDLTDFLNDSTKYKVKDDKSGTYETLTYSQMSEKQRKNTISTIMSNNAENAKILAWLNAGHKYYASESKYAELRKLGVKGNLYRGTKGFVKK